MRRILISVLLVFSLLLLTGCGVEYKYIKEVDCVVIGKKYEDSYFLPMTQTSVDFNGNVTTTIVNQYYSEEFYTYLYYEELDLSATFRDEGSYNQYNEGDIVKMGLYKHPEKNVYRLRGIQ